MFVVLLDIAPLLRWRSFRGRRQLPQAGEVRRPPVGARVVRRWVSKVWGR